MALPDGEKKKPRPRGSANLSVVSVGFDKSDDNFIGTWRVCNRRRGNLSLHVTSFACLEGPVAENYENKKRTIGNPNYPIRQTVQDLYDDRLYCLSLTTPDRLSCACLVVKPVPEVAATRERPIKLALSGMIIPESCVQWSQTASE